MQMVKENEATNNDSKKRKLKTADTAQLGLYMMLLLGSLALLVRKYRAGRLYFGVLMHVRVHQDLFHIVWKGVVIESEENCKCTNGYHFISEYSWVLIT